jgi:hypothetical protein
MHSERFIMSRVLFALILVFTISGLSNGADKRPLTHDDCDSWKVIAGSGLSAAGNWLYYLESVTRAKEPRRNARQNRNSATTPATLPF